MGRKTQGMIPIAAYRSQKERAIHFPQIMDFKKTNHPYGSKNIGAIKNALQFSVFIEKS